MEAMDIFVYIYSDQLMTELLASCKVEVQSLTCILSQNAAGVVNTIGLPFKAGSSREVEVYTSDPKHVFLPKNVIGNKVSVSPNESNSIQISSRTFSEV